VQALGADRLIQEGPVYRGWPNIARRRRCTSLFAANSRTRHTLGIAWTAITCVALLTPAYGKARVSAALQYLVPMVVAGVSQAAKASSWRAAIRIFSRWVEAHALLPLEGKPRSAG
jgi:hypothetical protein